MRSMLRRTILVSAIASFLISPAFAQKVPVSSLPSYHTFRKDMLAAGWIPDFNHGPKHDNGRPMYDYPEVLCGNRICSAQWISKADRERVEIILWPDAKVGYRVALQFGDAN